MLIRILPAFLCFFFSASFFCGAAESQNNAHCPSLADIKKRGKLLVGTYTDDPYFSYKNSSTQQLEGFDIDMAHAIAQELLSDPNKIEFVSVSPQNRMTYLQTGNVDLVLAELSITKEREKQIDFSDVYYIAGQSILVKANGPFDTLYDLKGKTIGILQGTTNEENVKEVLPNSKYVFFKTLNDGFNALREGKIQGLSIDDVLLLGVKANAPSFFQDFRFIGGEYSLESYGIAVKKGCGELLQAINQALKNIKQDGRWQQIYDKNIGRVSQVSAHPPM